MPDSIWDMAIEQQKQRDISLSTTNSLKHKESSLLIVGSKGVGKTTLIQRLLERQDPAKPTLALEYTYGRRSNQSLAKDVCHIFELGGGTLSTNLLETPMSPARLDSLHVILMVDLSNPHQLWFTLETMMAALQARIAHSLKTQDKAGGSNLEKRLQSAGAVRSANSASAGGEHADSQFVKPLLIPTIIIGGKYDIFQDLDPEKKKTICRALRFFAHYHGATLQFYSAMDSGLVKKAKDLLNHHAFETDPSKGMSQDYNKPLIIPAWSDSFEAITGSPVTGDQRQNLELWKHQFTTKFPQTVTVQSALPEDPCKDPNFREPLIDELRAQKDEELERCRSEVQQKNKQWGDYFDQSMKF